MVYTNPTRSVYSENTLTAQTKVIAITNRQVQRKLTFLSVMFVENQDTSTN